MRRFLILGFLAALAPAQGRQTTEAFYVSGSCGPGYVQRDFLDALLARLGREFGDRRAASMVDHLRAAPLDARAALKLVNGQLADADLRGLFGLEHERPQFVRSALDAAVADKDRRLLFGALVRTMVEKGVDPSSDFCQLRESRDRLTDDQFERLCRGEASAPLMGEWFRLRSKKDQQAMLGFMDTARASAYLLHPIGASLAVRAGLRGRFDPAKFPKPCDEMPGYGNDFKDGKAGGLPFDRSLPPVPYYGRNLEDFFATK